MKHSHREPALRQSSGQPRSVRDGEGRARPHAAGSPRQLLGTAGWLLGRVWKEAVSVRGRVSARHEQGPGSGRHPAPGWSGRRPAWRAGRNTRGTCGKAGPGGLRGRAQASEVTSGSGQPGTPGSPPIPQPHPCHGKSETVRNCRRLETEPYTDKLPRGLPSAGKAPGLGVTEGARGPLCC